MPKFSVCPCVRAQEEEVHILDYRHCSLDFLPSDVFIAERTLEELYLDANQIRDLPRELFYCHGLRKLTVSDNDLISIPPAISSLAVLEYLDFSKNGVIDLPENIKQCKTLAVVEASVNPLGKLPEGFTQLLNLSELYLNDTFLDYLPGSFGRLTKLKILEVRENHLKTLPKSLSRLVCLERLDIGNNDFTELPEVVGTLGNLLELWCDTNQLRELPACIGELRQLMFLDASKNRISHISPEIQGCLSLADLHLSINLLESLPETLGRLSSLTSLKVDDNRLTSLPFSIGGLVSLSELNISANDLEEIPPSIGLLRCLRTLYADENFISEIPPELGSCSGLTVLSLRTNNLTYIPDELGRIPRLRVLTLSDNRLSFLPYSLTRLKEIQALWLAENQTKPLVRLQCEVHEETGQRVLTCYLLPQQPTDERDELYSDTDSFHPSMWEEEREQRQQIKFDFGELDEAALSRLKRTPTPYPKEMKQRVQHMRNLALKQSGHLSNGMVMREASREQYDKVSGRASLSSLSSSHVGDHVIEYWDGPPLGSRSPLLAERHVVLRADKERQERDKARLRQRETGINEGRKNRTRDSVDTQDDGGFSTASSGRRDGHPGNQSAPRNTYEPSNHSNQHDPSNHPSNHPDNHPSNQGIHGQQNSQNRNSGRNQGPYNNNDNKSPGEVLTADATYPSHLQPAYQPLPHLMQPHSQQQRRSSNPRSTAERSSGNYSDVPRTYADFIRDLQAKSNKQRAWRGDGGGGSVGRAGGNASVHRRGGAGYESDVGYRSEGVMHGMDGYRSDTVNGYRHVRNGGGGSVGRAGGYNSDWGGGTGSVSGRRHKHAGYASDNEAYARKKQHKYYSAMMQQTGPGNDVTMTSAISTDQVILNYNAAGYTANPYPANVKHSHLRSDEMYEQPQQKPSHANTKSTYPSNQPNTVFNSSALSSQSDRQKGRAAFRSDRQSGVMSDMETDRQKKQVSGRADRQSGAVSDREVDRGKERVSGRADRQKVEKEGGSSDDDRYKAQLYEASVRLQKSPNDSARRRKQQRRESASEKSLFTEPLTSSNSAGAYPMTSSHTVPSNLMSTKSVTSDVYSSPRNTVLSKSQRAHLPSSFINNFDSPRSQGSSQGQIYTQGHERLFQAVSIRKPVSQQSTPQKNSSLVSKSLTFPTPTKNSSNQNQMKSHTLTDINEVDSISPIKYKHNTDINMNENRHTTTTMQCIAQSTPNPKTNQSLSLHQYGEPSSPPYTKPPISNYQSTYDVNQTYDTSSKNNTPSANHNARAASREPQHPGKHSSRPITAEQSRMAPGSLMGTPGALKVDPGSTVMTPGPVSAAGVAPASAGTAPGSVAARVAPGSAIPAPGQRWSNYEHDVAVYKRGAGPHSGSVDSGYVHSHERTAGLSQTSLNSPRDGNEARMQPTPGRNHSVRGTANTSAVARSYRA